MGVMTVHVLPRQSKTIKYFPLIFIGLLSLFLNPVFSIEATFTPAPDKDTGSTEGPLPLSQNQRNELLKLDQQISSSSNPPETLKKVAEGSDMTADELGNLLIRNRRDMEMANAGSGPDMAIDTIPRRFIRTLSSLFLLTVKSASSRPRSFTFMAMTLLIMVYVIISAPRTGVVLSTGRNFVSTGHTTVWAPPRKYLSNYMESDTFQNRQSRPSIHKLSQLFVDDEMGQDCENDVVVESLSKKQKKKLKLVVTAKKNIPFELLLPAEDDLESIYEKEFEGRKAEDRDNAIANLEEKAWEDAMMLAFESSAKILSSRRFSEFVSSPANQMRFYSPVVSDHRRPDVENAALIVKSMGDWKRFGIQPLRLAYEENKSSEKSIVYHTLTGGQFDGELRIAVQKVGQDQEENKVIISVTILVPKNGRKINTTLASTVALLLAESISSSVMTVAKQIVSRKEQSTSYRGRVKRKASEKRHNAFENLKKMEEMAEERRRRWQRSNRNSGNYRPSGDMMKGPGGGPSRSF